MSVNGNGTQSIVGGTLASGDTTGGFIVGATQTLSLNNINEVKGFTTAIQNSGTVNITDVTFTDNTTDVENGGQLNLYGTDVFDKISGTNGTTFIGTDPNDSSNYADVTVNTSIVQNSVEVSGENNKLTIGNTFEAALTNSGIIDNQGTMTVNGGSNTGEISGTGSFTVADNFLNDTTGTIEQGALTVNADKTLTNRNEITVNNSVNNSGTIENSVEAAVLNLKGEDMTVAGIIKNATGAEINIDGTGTTTLSAQTTNNGDLNIKSDTTITGKVDGAGSTINTADTLSIQAAIEQATFTNTSGEVTVADTNGSITTTGKISNADTITSKANNLSAAGGIENSNILNLTGGENANVITVDNGTTNFSGTGTNSAAVTQKDITNTGSLTNNALITAANNIVNDGTLTSLANNLKADNGIQNNNILNLTGGENTNVITGNDGTVNFSNTGTNSAAITQKNVTNTGNLSNSALITAANNIINSGTLTSNADNLVATNGIQNTNSLILTGGETKSTISGSDGTTHIQGNVLISKTITDNIISLDKTSDDKSGVASLGITDISTASTLVANGGDLNLQQLTGTENYKLGSVDLQQNMGLAIDVNLSPTGEYNKAADTISADSVTGDSKILINNIKIAADSGDIIPAYAKVTDNVLKDKTGLGTEAKVDAESLIVKGVTDNFTVTYEKDSDEQGGYLKFAYSDLYNAVHSETETKSYVMTSNENVTKDLGELGGKTLSISGNNKAIKGQGSTEGITVGENQKLTVYDVTEYSGFDTAINNTAGSVTLENVTMKNNTTDVDNDKTLNLNGTDVLDTIIGSGSTTIGDGNTKTGNVTINTKLEQDSLTLSSSDDKLTNKGTSTIKDVVNKGTIDNQKELNITNSVDNSGTIANTIENAVLNLTGKDMTVGGTITNVANAEININGTGTTTLSAQTTNNGDLNTKSDTKVTGSVSGTGNTTNTADNLSVEGSVAQKTFTNESGTVTVDDEKGSITTTDNIVNKGTLTSNADNLKAGGEIQNSNELNLTGGENTNKITGNTGTTNFSNDVTNSGTVTQKDVTNTGNLTNNALITAANNIVNDGTLTSNADNLKAGNEVKNNDTLNLTGGTNTNKITGQGETNTSGTVVNEGSITQSALNNTGNLTNNSAIVAAVTNDGTLTNNDSITGNVTNNGTTDNKGNIDGNVVSSENSVFDNNGTITGTVENSGTFTNNDKIGGDITNTETGDFDNNSAITTNLDNSGNFDNVDGTVSGNVDNKETGIITTKIKGLAGQSINNDGTIKYVDSGSTIRDITGNGRVELLSEDNGTVKLNNKLDNNTLALYNGTLIFDKVKNVASFEANGGTIDAINGKDETVNLGKVTINGKTNVKLDFNLGSEGTDKFKSSSITNNGGSFNVSAVKVNGMTMKDHIRVHLGDTTTLGKSNVTSDTFNLPTVLTPIRYIKGNVAGGYLTYEPTGNSYRDFNPAIMASSVTQQVAGYQNQMQSLHDGFFHMERYMKYSQEDRLVAENAHKYAALEAVVDFDENIAPEVSQAMWTKPYTTFERVNLKGGVKVNNIAYGMMYGGDTDMFKMQNGFKGVISAFVGYNGNHMSYDGVTMQQNGGYLGTTFSAYKGNFFTGVTVSTGASNGDADTAYGKDDITLLTAGIANKTGYNFEFKDGRIILQPSVFTGYSWVNTFDYTNSAGARMHHDALNALQIAPGIKLIGNTRNGWQPYATADVVWNIFMGRGQV